MYNYITFSSFVSEPLFDGTYLVRVSDDVLDHEDWPVHVINIKQGIVVDQRIVQDGVYSIPAMIAWPEAKIQVWTQEDNTGSHPCIEHDIARLS